MQESLNASERSALKNGDDSFIGQEIRDANLWDEQLKRKREIEEDKFKGISLENIRGLQVSMFGPTDLNKEAKKYGMPPRPEAPDEDFLSCFHQQWNESKSPEIQGERQKLLRKTRCKFHYWFGKTQGGETLEACEKNRKENQDRRRFFITTIMIIVGIIVTILVGLLPFFSTQRRGLREPT